MSTLQRLAAPLNSSWAFGKARGLMRLNLRPAGSNNPVPIKKYLFGSAGPLPRMWDGSRWRRIILAPESSGASTTFVQNSGNTVNDASTFGGYTLAQIAKAIIDSGMMT